MIFRAYVCKKLPATLVASPMWWPVHFVGRISAHFSSLEAMAWFFPKEPVTWRHVLGLEEYECAAGQFVWPWVRRKRSFERCVSAADARCESPANAPLSRPGEPPSPGQFL